MNRLPTYSHSMIQCQRAVSRDNLRSLSRNVEFMFKSGGIFAYCGLRDGSFLIWSTFHYFDVPR